MIEDSQPTAPDYDLLISYSPADREWVEGYLFDVLDAANVRVHSEFSFALGAPRQPQRRRHSARTTGHFG